MLNKRPGVIAWLSFLLALGAGALTVFAFAPYRLWWLMPLLLAALGVLAERRPQQGFALGYGFGLAAYTSNFHWIYQSLHNVAGLPAFIAAPLVLLLPAYLALYPGLTLWWVGRLQPRPSLRWLIAFPAAWTLTEWLRSWMLTGFPWGAIGYSQITESPLSSFAPIGGIHLVTFAVALTAGAVVTLYRLRGAWLLLPIAASTALWWGAVALKPLRWTEPAGAPISVALGQGNIPQALKWRPDVYEMTLARYYRQVATTRADLMILPETALPAFLDDLPAGYLTMLLGDATRKNMALALGIPRHTRDGEGYLNAVVALTEPGAPSYAKDHLVPFGEFVPLPLVTGWIYQFMDMPMSGFSRGGARQAPIALAGQKVAFNVCYEDSFGEELIGPAKSATMLANVSNLAWFGKSNAMSQHLQLSQARALETGRPMLRATNTGMTAIIGPDGRIDAVAAPDTEQVLTGQVQGYGGDTPYMRVGNMPVLLGAALLALIAGLIGRRR
ncbi:apolipoprotein N-acyltransferase [Crenobacter cavernae]|uniref:Apolipoprotein N-acyltransferase n=1 Tax=Crenobacter cavernae TaxID=2290923 RepID=A0ABY0FF47_9NEIS|nr:apolipoprotein N-acyltransferase [Crenobacter cavernae]RXZ44656.1 apolipoprotein N-acyltransferase [Crenobacter cavernae]